MGLFLLLSAKHNLLCLADSFVLYATVGFLHSFLTSSLKKHTFYNLLINNILYLCVT